MFKKIAIVSSLLLSFSSFAGCLETYQANLVETRKALSESNEDQARMEGMAISAGLGLITTTTASGGTAAVSTTVGGELLAALYVGRTYIDLRMDADVAQLHENESKLTSAISLMFEADIGYGPILNGAMYVNELGVSPDVSVADLALAIRNLDDSNAFCRDNQISTVKGIIDMAQASLI